MIIDSEIAELLETFFIFKSIVINTFYFFSVATIKPNTTSDTLVDKKFTLSRDRMSDTEEDQNSAPPRGLSNVLQPSRTELQKNDK